MDVLSSWIFSIQNPYLHAFDSLVDNPLIFAGIVMVLVAFAEKRATKRSKILTSILMAFLLASIAKSYFSVHRPCFGEEYCPIDYSFPSLHAATVFALMCGFLNKRSFPLFLFFAIVICFSRINFGVHTFYDIAASLPVALICYYLVDWFFEKKGYNEDIQLSTDTKKGAKHDSKIEAYHFKRNKNNEIPRKLFHIVLGLVLISLINHFGRGFVIVGIFFGLLIGTIIINQRILGNKIKWILYLEDKFERSDVPVPGWGFACYLIGVLLLLSFLTDIGKISAGIFILAFGDAFSGLIGRYGKIRYPYNKRKSLEGSIAFFLASLPASYFIGWQVVPLALIVAIFETVPEIEDNIMITIVSTLLLLLI